MRHSSFRVAFSFFVAAASWLTLTGCQSGSSENASDDAQRGVPESFAEAVESTALLGKTIQAAYATGDPEGAHGPLHEIGPVLTATPALIEQSDMSDADKAEAKEAAMQLFEAFSMLDQIQHGGGAESSNRTEYDVVAARITTGLEALAAKLEVAGAKPAAE